MPLATLWRVSAGVLSRPYQSDVPTAPPPPEEEPAPPGRDALVYGTYLPTIETVGHTGTLTDLGTPATQTANLPAGGLIENRRIYGDIKWTGAQDLTLRNCLLVGGTNVPTGASAVVNCNSAHGGILTLIDCTVQPREPRNRDCIVGHKWRAYRCNLIGGVDGMGIFITSANGTHADVVAMGNWVHELTYIYPDYKNGTSGAAQHTDGSHNDGAQLQGGDQVHLKGNFFDLEVSKPAASNTGPNPEKAWMTTLKETNGSCVIVQSNTGMPINDTVIIEQNYFRGGLSHLNVKPNMKFIYRDNKHFRDAAINSTGSGGTWNGYWIRVDQRSGAVLTGLATNTWQDGPYAAQAMTEPRDKGIHYNV